MKLSSIASCCLTIISFVMFSSTAYAEDHPPCNVEQARKDLAVIMARDVHVRMEIPVVIENAEAKVGRKLTGPEIYEAAVNFREGDKKNQDELDRIVAACGWPTKAVLGAESVRIAGMIMVHAPHDFTDRHFDDMMASYKAGEIAPIWMATVIDNRLLEEGKPQRYDTRAQPINADAPRTLLEDPEHLQERRTAFGITPWTQHDVTNPQ